MRRKMRSEGDGSQLLYLQRDTRSQCASRRSYSREPPPGHGGIPESAASGEEPGSPVRSLTTVFPPASLRRSCRAILPECGERHPRTREERRREEDSSASPSPYPPSAKEPEHAAAMRALTERFPPPQE